MAIKPCSECPFLKSSPLIGSPEWLKDIVMLNKADKFFRHTCHKTDPNADGYKGSKKVRECAGHLTVMFNEMDRTPGAGGVYDSYGDMIETYLREWLGDAEVDKMKYHSKKEVTK